MLGRRRGGRGFEFEPEVRDWLDSLSGSGFERVDEVCGMLAEKGTGLAWELPMTVLRQSVIAARCWRR